MSSVDNIVYISKLILDLANTSRDIRESAAINLIEVGHEVIHYLMDDLHNPDALVDLLNADGHWSRYYAAWSLGELKDARAIKPLRVASNTSDTFFKHDCKEALLKLGYGTSQYEIEDDD